MKKRTNIQTMCTPASSFVVCSPLAEGTPFPSRSVVIQPDDEKDWRIDV
jgi:hypothetical protein